MVRAFCLFCILIASCLVAHAERLELLSPDDDVVGAIQVTKAYERDTLIDIAREFDLGYDQIVKANPKVNRWVPGHGTKVRLPSMYVLPDAPREGIILNLPELRIYYFPKGSRTTVYTFPVSVGRMDWRTPMGVTKVVRKDKDPAWYPPESIREEHARDGDPLPKMIPGGTPENPLGRYALRLGKAGYLIHGTDERKSFGIGMRVTHGCLRMYPEDIEQVFQMVPVNTKVNIIDQPVKVGRRGNKVYLEAHLPFEEEEAEPTDFQLQGYRNVAFTKIRAEGIEDFDTTQVRRVIEEGSGVPTPIARQPLETENRFGKTASRSDEERERGSRSGFYDETIPQIPGREERGSGYGRDASRESAAPRPFDEESTGSQPRGWDVTESDSRYEGRARSDYGTSEINRERSQRRRYERGSYDREDPDLRRYEKSREQYEADEIAGNGESVEGYDTRDQADSDSEEDLRDSTIRNQSWSLW